LRRRRRRGSAVVVGTAVAVGMVAVGMEVLALQDAELSSVAHLSVAQHFFRHAGSGSIAVSLGRSSAQA